MTMRRFGTLGSLTKFLLDLNIYGDGDSRICKGGIFHKQIFIYSASSSRMYANFVSLS